MVLVLLFAVLLSPQFGKPGAPNSSASPQQQDYGSNSGATQRDVVYTEIGHTRLRLDVYAPHEKPSALVPGIILIHGGSWQEGDKAWLGNMGRLLAKSGYVAFSINYRLHDGKKNRWPAQLDDAQTAVRWVRAHAAEYNVDPKRIGAWGHSAGAQMAALLGELDTRDNSNAALAQYSSRVQAVVDVSGPADFTANHDADGDAFFTDLLGVTEKQDEARWKAASPVFNINKDTAPFLIVHGTRDGDVPIGQSVQFANALQHAGIPVTLVQVDDGHAFETEAAKRRLAMETVKFFDEVFAPK